MTKRYGQHAGLSLVELLTVLMIAGILAAVAIPSYSGLVAKSRVGGAATTLQLAMVKARSEAVKRNAAVTITRQSGGWVAGWQILDAGSAVLATQEPISNVSITSSTTSIVYLSSGRIQGTAPSFLIESPTWAREKRCVSADLSGRPYVKGAAC